MPMDMLRALSSLLLTGLVVCPVGAGPAAGEPASGRFEFERLNRSYTDELPSPAPIQHGPMTVRLSSPGQVFVLRRHLLELEAEPDGTHRARLTVEFLGKGRLLADIGAGEMSSRLEDEIQLPRQTRVFEGRLRIRRVEGGYLVTAEELPPRVEITVHSGLGSQLVDWCDRMSLLPLPGLDCPALARSVSIVAVPLPPPGESFLVAAAELTEAERREIEAYLSAAGVD